MDEAKMSLTIAGEQGEKVLLFRNGAPVAYDETAAKACFAGGEVFFHVEMGLGGGEGKAWGSDLTDEFVRLNSQYTT
jgi:glutamate N-acetyltransferase/amino-acid N-acetyltransferase